MKRFLSLFLLFALCYSINTGVLIASAAEGDGSLGNPYIVHTQAEFDVMSGNTNYYRLGNNLTLGSQSSPYTPSTFKVKSFDGAGYTIDVYIESTSNTGLFTNTSGITSAFEIKNLTVTGTIKSAGTVGGIFSTTNALATANITNCVNRATVTSTAARAGGIVGYTTGSVNLKNCKNYGNITGQGTSGVAGGLIGRIDKAVTIKESQNFGKVTSDSPTMHAAGIIGWVNAASAEIESCGNYGSVSTTGSGNAGGIAGVFAAAGASGAISKCFNMGDITAAGAGYSGGIVGSGASFVKSVTNCFNAGRLFSGKAENICAIVSNVTENLKYCYNLYSLADLNIFVGTSTPATAGNYNINAGDAKASLLGAEAFKLKDSFSGWSFAADWENPEEGDIWCFIPGSGYDYPQLVSSPLVADSRFGGGFGVDLSPFKIDTAEHFENMNENLGKSYILTKDLDLTNIVPFNFTGVLMGNNKKVKVDIDFDTAPTGLFPSIYGYVAITDLTIDGKVRGAERTGAFFGQGGEAPYTILAGSKIENCTNLAEVSGAGHVGGIGGRLYGTMTISLNHLQNHGAVSGTNSYVGGIFGLSPAKATISNSGNTGSVINTQNWAGGILGWSYSSNIQSCYNTGFVEALKGAGGIIGYNSAIAAMSQCYNTGRISITDSAAEQPFGGLIGEVQLYKSGTDPNFTYTPRTATVTNCYNAGYALNNNKFIPIGISTLYDPDNNPYPAITTSGCYYISSEHETALGAAAIAQTYMELIENQELLANGFVQGEANGLAYPKVSGCSDIPIIETLKFYSPTAAEEFYDEQIEANVTAHHGITFGSVIDSVGNYEQGGFGMILSKEDIDESNFNLSNPKIRIFKGIMAPDSRGIFGIRFYGLEILSGNTYYVRTYGIYKNGGDTFVCYGDIKIVTIGISD